jgi:hypothetical protein
VRLPPRCGPRGPAGRPDRQGPALAASQAAFSTQHLTQEDLAATGAQEVEDLWRQVPGMHVNDYQLSGVANAVVLRGFGGAATVATLPPRWTASPSTKPCPMPTGI